MSINISAYGTYIDDSKVMNVVKIRNETRPDTRPDTGYIRIVLHHFIRLLFGS